MKNISQHSPPQTFFSTPPRKVLALAIILVLFLLNAAWSDSFSAWPSDPVRVESTRTLVPTHSPFVNTPSPEEIQANHSQTDGIAVFGGIIVLVIVAGTFFVLRRKL
jgi:hypothetical protein